MRRWLAVAALSAGLLTASAWAQRGVGGHGAGFGGHAAMGARPSGGFHGGNFGRPGFSRPGFGFGRRPFFHHHFHHHRFSPWWGWGYGYPWWYGDLGWYDSSSYAEQYYPQNDYANAYYVQSNQIQQQQQAEIDRLNNEVERLRTERNAQLQARASQPEAESQPTELVFRDKRTEEIQNYAIAGQTLWVLTEQRARKIPLSELDVAATKKANEDRGIEFELPR